jgi:hypothetical protein
MTVEREIVGRGDELAALAEFVGRSTGTPSALVLEGEPGIGMSTLWLAAGDVARERGVRVLSSPPTEVERSFAFAGLADLFEDALDDVAASLSPPRRRALETALLVSESPGGVDPRALGVAVRNTLELLAADAPLLVAIDDVQWFGPFVVGSALVRDQAPRVPGRPRARACAATGDRPHAALPVPETLEGLLSDRLAGLPTDTRDALVLAAVLGTPSLKLLQTAGVGEDVLEPAMSARVVEREDGALRFTHPLLASVVYQALTAGSAGARTGFSRTSSSIRCSGRATSHSRPKARSRRSRRRSRRRPRSPCAGAPWSWPPSSASTRCA